MQTRRSFMSLALVGSLAITAGVPVTALASIEDDARSFLTNLGNTAIAELTDESVPKETRRQRFRQLLIEAVDFPLISQQVLGRYWRASDEKTRQEFTVVLRETLIARFLPLFDSYEGQTFEVVATRTSSQDKTLVGATTNVMAPNGNIAKVEWFLKQNPDGLRIYDFATEGIRLTTSLQDEYGAVVRRANGDVNALITDMKRKLPPDAQLD